MLLNFLKHVERLLALSQILLNNILQSKYRHRYLSLSHKPLIVRTGLVLFKSGCEQLVSEILDGSDIVVPFEALISVCRDPCMGVVTYIFLT